MTLGTPGKPAPFMSGEPFHRCTHTALVAERRDLRLRRLRQCARAQIFAGRQAAAVVGRIGHAIPASSTSSTTSLRRRWLGLCRGPREPSRAGVRRQRPLRGAVEQSAPPVRPVHAARQMPDLLHRRARAGDAGQPQRAEPRAAADDRRSHGQAHRPPRRVGAGIGPGEFMAPHGLAVDSHGDIYVGEVSWTNWPQTWPNQPRPDNLRSLHKFRKVKPQHSAGPVARL